MNDKRRHSLIMDEDADMIGKLCRGRSGCDVCLGSHYCCRHIRYASIFKKYVESLDCVCGGGCTKEKLLEGHAR